MRRGNRQCPQLAIAHLRRGQRRGVESEQRLTRQQPRDGLRRGAVRHMRHIEVLPRREHHRSKVRDNANASAGIGLAPWIGAQMGHQISHIAKRRLTAHHQQIGQQRKHRHRHKGGQIIKRQPAHEEGIGDLPRRIEQQRMPITRRLRHRRSANRTRCARAIFNHHALPQRSLHMRRHQPQRGIGRATAGPAGHDAHRAAGRPGLRQGGGGKAEKGEAAAGDHAPLCGRRRRQSSRIFSAAIRPAIKARSSARKAASAVGPCTSGCRPRSARRD